MINIKIVFSLVMFILSVMAYSKQIKGKAHKIFLDEGLSGRPLATRLKKLYPEDFSSISHDTINTWRDSEGWQAEREKQQLITQSNDAGTTSTEQRVTKAMIDVFDNFIAGILDCPVKSKEGGIKVFLEFLDKVDAVKAQNKPLNNAMLFKTYMIQAALELHPEFEAILNTDRERIEKRAKELMKEEQQANG